MLRKGLCLSTAAAAASTSNWAIQHGMQSVPETTYSSLPNGFRIACECSPKVEFVTIGVWIDAGSRFETLSNNGVAHFLEHLNFKGTKRFNKSYIDTLFEHLGAHFNAYTSRDRTAYYIKVFNKDVEKVIELLADILRNGRYDPKDIEFERPTILAEMREVEALVDEVIMDNLHLVAYDPTVSGLPLTILGPELNIAKSIDREMVTKFVETHYTGPRMSLISSGGLSHERVEELARKYFGDLPSQNNRPTLLSRYTGGITSMWNASMKTSHVAWAIPVCGAGHRDVVSLQLLHQLIGSYRRDAQDVHFFQGMNRKESRRQRIGINVESVQSFFTPYEETGLFGFYSVSVPSGDGKDDSATKMLEVLGDDLHDLSYNKISIDDLETAKSALKAANVLALDSTTNSAEDLGRQMIHHGRRIPMQELFESIDAITPDSLMQTIHRYYVGATPTISAVGPPGTLPEYSALRYSAKSVL